jgi:hypothetical protein
MRVRHPNALDDDAPPVDSRVHIGGRRDTHPVDDDGVITVDDGVPRSAVVSWAKGYGYDLKELLVDEDDDHTRQSEDEDDEESGETDNDAELCGTEMSDGTVCKRPADECPYHE